MKMVEDDIDMGSTHEHDKSYENETPAPSPRVQISLKIAAMDKVRSEVSEIKTN